jgi:hypothetical protein
MRRSPSPPASINLPDVEDQVLHVSKATQVLSLCTSIQDTTESAIHLSVERGALYQHIVSGAACTLMATQGISESLSRGLLQNETELDIKSKICLATVLSYALLDFCGEPWFPCGWTKDGIHLLRHNQVLYLRPALIAQVPTRFTSTASATTNDLRLLYHGILLMEIFLQDALTINLRQDSGLGVEELRGLAREEFEAMEGKWDVYERYKQAVEVCIEGIIVGDGLSNDEAFAMSFCQSVVDPLEADYTSLWGSRDLDKVVSELEMPIVTPPPRAPKPKHFKVSSQFCSRAQR